MRVTRKMLRPGDHLTVARKHHFKIEYEMLTSGDRTNDDENYHKEKSSDEPVSNSWDSLFSQSLLERAGLARRPPKNEPTDEMPPED